MERRRTIVLVEDFEHPVEVVWKAISDTERLNIAVGTGFTPYFAEDLLQADGTVIRHARKRIGPFVWRWREGFGQWSDKKFFHHERIFFNGPFLELSAKMIFEERGSGSSVKFNFLARWESILGDILNHTGFLKIITSALPKTAKKLVAEQDAVESSMRVSVSPASVRSKVDQRRVTKTVAELNVSPYSNNLTRRLVDHLEAAHPLDLRRLRPLALAKLWGEPPDQVVELFVAAHRAGLLAMRWEILCSRCRGGKSQSLLLSDMPRDVHCDSCNIDYKRDFANNVELVFSPSPWFRTLPEGEFCLMSAASTPHVKLQCDIRPGEMRVERMPLADGRYRIRTIETGGSCEVDLYGGAVPEICVDGDEITIGDPAPTGSVCMVNADTRPRTVVIETTAWKTDALTGPAVVSMQAFRDLCPEHLIRPGDDVEIDRVAILFSDLKGSTALYEVIGDSRAFALVREHFVFLEERVHRHRGCVVKTIGDAVMAAFQTGNAALAAALDIQDGVAAFNASQDLGAIELKIGLHEGPCIAVTTKGVLDYFGTTVNMAARLQSEANGGEIVLSDDVQAYPLSTQMQESGRMVGDRAFLAGFDQPVSFSRVLNSSDGPASNATN